MSVTTLKMPPGRRRLLAAGLAVCLAVTALALATRRRAVVAIGPVPAAVIVPVLAEDWQRVAVVASGPCCGRAPATAAQMIRAHALLATNRNTEAACILLNATDHDLDVWVGWTAELVRRYPGESAAHYLRADALARRRRYPEALAEYDRALQIAPQNALALNGRGQVYAALADWPHAISDFDKATRASPDLADAFANRGWLDIDKKAGAPGAAKWFDEALHAAPDFALAKHGRGCAELVLGQSDVGQKDYRDPAKAGKCIALLVADNTLGVAAYLRGISREELNERLAQGDPGTTFNVQTDYQHVKTLFNKVLNDMGSQGTFNKYHTALSRLPIDQQNRVLDNLVKPALARNPTFRESYLDHETRVFNHNNNPFTQSLGTIIQDLGKAGNIGLSAASVFMKPIRVAQMIVGGGLIDAAAEHAGRRVDLQTQQNLWTSRHTFESLKTPPPPKPDVGGVDSQALQTRMDDGDWPFTAYYGLMYVHVPHLPGHPLERKQK